jgi:uncharacterized membrane-anchored protein
MKRGIMVFDQIEQEWRIWIGQHSYFIDEGDSFGLRIQNVYYGAFLQKDSDWFITLGRDVRFILHVHEVYKVRIRSKEYYHACCPPF